MRHSDKPRRVDGSGEEVIHAKLDRILGSKYVESIRALTQKLPESVIRATEGGFSGYILYFDDGTYLIAFLADNRLQWKIGVDKPSSEDLSLIRSTRQLDASSPQDADRPYANEFNNIATEVAKSQGQVIDGIAIGEATFSITFPDGHELDATLMPISDGRKGLRVFWEQW